MSDPRNITVDDFDYPLPDERIAKHPLTERDTCRLLVCRGGEISDHGFAELPELLPADAMLVYNNTRVINARLRFRKGADRQGALIEIFCLEPAAPADYALNFASTDGCSWHCLVGNSKRWREGSLSAAVNVAGEGEVTLRATRIERSEGASSVVRFEWDNPSVTFSQIIASAGEIPIPPYLNRKTEDSDTRDYQTVYSHIEGSVAAPTAGLHFTPRTLADIDARGIPRRELTLHVGAGTFQPVKADNIGDHPMHSEWIAVSRDLIAELATTPRQVIAVGTTSVRTLESLYHIGVLIADGKWDGELPQWTAYENAGTLTASEALQAIVDYLDTNRLTTLIASTRIIIAPGYRYRIVRGMVTNFHQPRSTLLLLLSAFLGGKSASYGDKSASPSNECSFHGDECSPSTDWRALYDHALASSYRFLSYGDACLLLP